VRWNLNNDGISWSNWSDVAHWEVLVVSGEEVVLGVFVHSLDRETSAVSDQVSRVVNLIAGQVSVTDKLLTWLIYCEGLGKFLSSQVDGE